VLINTSPEPFSNWAASVTEDVAVLGGLWAALHYPIAFLVAFVVFLILAIWMLPKIWRGIVLIFRKVRGIFVKDNPPPTFPTPPPPRLGS